MLPLPCMLVCRFCLRKSHARPRVQQAPGLPCALCFQGATKMQTSGDQRRENAKLYPAVIASAAKQSMSRHKERVDCFAALAMTWRERSSSVGLLGYESSARCCLVYRSCRVSRPCGVADRTAAFFAGVSPPVSAITETATTRSTMASTSLRSHCPSDNFVSRSFSRMV